MHYATCSAGRRKSSPRARPGSTSSCSTRPISTTGPGNPYLGPDGLDWPDNAQRFAALARVGADIGSGAVAGFVPEVVHAHDWQAALAPAYLHYDGGRAAGDRCSPSTISPFRAIFPLRLLARSACRRSAMTIDGVEYFGGVGFLKAGPATRRPDHHGLADLCRARS